MQREVCSIGNGPSGKSSRLETVASSHYLPIRKAGVLRRAADRCCRWSDRRLAVRKQRISVLSVALSMITMGLVGCLPNLIPNAPPTSDDGSSGPQVVGGGEAARVSPLVGTWEIGGNGVLLGLFTFDQGGALASVCRFDGLTQEGVDVVAVNGPAQEIAPGGTMVTTATVNLDEDVDPKALSMRLEINFIAVGIVAVGQLTITIDAILISTETAEGTARFQAQLLGEDPLDSSGDVLLHRISLESQTCLFDDMEEPNDAPDQAVPLAVGAVADLRSFNDDWYRVEVPERQTIMVRINYDHVFGDLGLFAYDGASVELLGESSVMGRDAQSLELPRGAGSYLLLVRGIDGSVNPEYAVMVESDDAFEQNDSMQRAAPIGGGAFDDLVLRDNDWFQILPAAPSTIEVTIRFAHSTGDLDLALYTADGSLVDLSGSTSDMEQVRNAGSASYFLQVFGFRGATNAYAMEVTLTPLGP